MAIDERGYLAGVVSHLITGPDPWRGEKHRETVALGR
jgi:hypothetical protein